VESAPEYYNLLSLSLSTYPVIFNILSAPEERSYEKQNNLSNTFSTFASSNNKDK